MPSREMKPATPIKAQRGECLAHLPCPACRNAVQRIPRHFSDRLRSLFAPVRRYRCVVSTCGWEGVRRSDAARAPGEQHML